jgi:hypothetical protein
MPLYRYIRRPYYATLSLYIENVLLLSFLLLTAYNIKENLSLIMSLTSKEGGSNIIDIKVK